MKINDYAKFGFVVGLIVILALSIIFKCVEIWLKGQS